MSDMTRQCMQMDLDAARREVEELRVRIVDSERARDTAIAHFQGEAEELRGQVAELESRLRHTAQVLIGEVGAAGPINAEEVAHNAVVEIARLRALLRGVLVPCELCHGEVGRKDGCEECDGSGLVPVEADHD